MASTMTRLARRDLLRKGGALSAVALVACGGAPAATLATATGTATATPTVAPTPTKPAVPATGQGAGSVKLGENKVAVAEGVAPDLAPGSYVSTVLLVTLQEGGRTPAHKHGGVETIHVLQGTVDFRGTATGRVMLAPGQGASVRPNTPCQAVNGGTGVAKFLAFFMTPESAAFQTNVDDAP